EAAQADLAALRQAGVQFLEPVVFDRQPVAAGWLQRIKCLLARRPDRFLVGTDRTAALAEALQGRMPDAVLTVWSENASNLVSTLPVPFRFTYAGNPDHKVLDARLELAERLGRVSLPGRLRNRARYAVTKAAHLQVIRRFDLMWNVAANDAADYRAAGINARYLQNMWPAAIHGDWEAARDATEQTAPLKIVGNVGNLSATGNSYGLLTMATEIVPELRRRLGDGGFEIHLFGGGAPHPAVQRHLDDPHIKVRGFVDDLDREILSAPIFLVANNSDRFKVGHTRFLHAWSLGAAVVGFADSALAMPEIAHGQNALLGQTPAELARHIVDLAADTAMRRRLGRSGADMVTGPFAPQRVTAQIASDIEEHMAASATRAGR
ncbi:MAG: glycosyltransferase family 4 protein, partial [Rhodospirillaceae bacterium]|nr:glycosyltransferase family 4 protein [Rhodospirillaceae bacterium]